MPGRPGCALRLNSAGPRSIEILQSTKLYQALALFAALGSVSLESGLPGRAGRIELWTGLDRRPVDLTRAGPRIEEWGRKSEYALPRPFGFAHEKRPIMRLVESRSVDAEGLERFFQLPWAARDWEGTRNGG